MKICTYIITKQNNLFHCGNVFYIFSVCHRKNGRCRGHEIGFGLCGNGKSEFFSVL